MADQDTFPNDRHILFEHSIIQEIDPTNNRTEDVELNKDDTFQSFQQFEEQPESNPLERLPAIQELTSQARYPVFLLVDDTTNKVQTEHSIIQEIDDTNNRTEDVELNKHSIIQEIDDTNNRTEDVELNKDDTFQSFQQFEEQPESNLLERLLAIQELTPPARHPVFPLMDDTDKVQTENDTFQSFQQFKEQPESTHVEYLPAIQELTPQARHPVFPLMDDTTNELQTENDTFQSFQQFEEQPESTHVEHLPAIQELTPQARHPVFPLMDDTTNKVQTGIKKHTSMSNYKTTPSNQSNNLKNNQNQTIEYLPAIQELTPPARHPVFPLMDDTTNKVQTEHNIIQEIDPTNNRTEDVELNKDDTFQSVQQFKEQPESNPLEHLPAIQELTSQARHPVFPLMDDTTNKVQTEHNFIQEIDPTNNRTEDVELNKDDTFQSFQQFKEQPESNHLEHLPAIQELTPQARHPVFPLMDDTTNKVQTEHNIIQEIDPTNNRTEDVELNKDDTFQSVQQFKEQPESNHVEHLPAIQELTSQARHPVFPLMDDTTNKVQTEHNIIQEIDPTNNRTEDVELNKDDTFQSVQQFKEQPESNHVEHLPAIQELTSQARHPVFPLMDDTTNKVQTEHDFIQEIDPTNNRTEDVELNKDDTFQSVQQFKEQPESTHVEHLPAIQELTPQARHPVFPLMDDTTNKVQTEHNIIQEIDPTNNRTEDVELNKDDTFQSVQQFKEQPESNPLEYLPAIQELTPPARHPVFPLMDDTTNKVQTEHNIIQEIDPTNNRTEDVELKKDDTFQSFQQFEEQPESNPLEHLPAIQELTPQSRHPVFPLMDDTTNKVQTEHDFIQEIDPTNNRTEDVELNKDDTFQSVQQFKEQPESNPLEHLPAIQELTPQARHPVFPLMDDTTNKVQTEHNIIQEIDPTNNRTKDVELNKDDTFQSVQQFKEQPESNPLECMPAIQELTPPARHPVFPLMDDTTNKVQTGQIEKNRVCNKKGQDTLLFIQLFAKHDTIQSFQQFEEQPESNHVEHLPAIQELTLQARHPVFPLMDDTTNKVQAGI
ncbi:unnamed protein product [Mytilus edulis]|uniref:Uncharacterized protein n=1 Tax=Mytilus edulis TaxID=6550 RepID=A0A8S3UJC0_MYTED|nr:unnamed protein product [Mytilus edulis]